MSDNRKYRVYAKFNGDDIYLKDESPQGIFTVTPGRWYVDFTVNNTTIAVGANIVLTAFVHDLNNVSGGTLNCTLIKEAPDHTQTTESVSTNSNGRLTKTLTYTTKGTYHFRLRVEGNQQGKTTSYSEIITVKVGDVTTTTTLSATRSTLPYGEESYLTATVTDAGGNRVKFTKSTASRVKLYQQGTTNYVTSTDIVNGNVRFALSQFSIASAGTYNFYAVYSGESGVYVQSTSTNKAITLQKKPSTINITTNTIYTGWRIMGNLTTRNTGTNLIEPVQNAQLRIEFNDHSYNILTDGLGNFKSPVISTSMTSMAYTVTFDGNASCTSSVAAGTVTIKQYETITKTPMSVKNVEKQIPYKDWINLQNTKVSGDGLKAECGTLPEESSIASKYGSRHTPNRLLLENFGFDLPTDSQILELKVTWKQAKLTNSSTTAYPTFGQPAITITGGIQATATGTMGSLDKNGNGNYGTLNATFNNNTLTSETVNNLSARLTNTANTSTNTGRLWIDYIACIIKYIPPQEAQ